MKGHLLIQAFFLCVLAIYVTMGLQSDLSKYETENIPLARAERATRTTPRPGFFKTLFSVLYEQWDDTRKTSATVSKAVNDNFLPESSGKNGATTPPTVVNGTTTEETRITRTELQKILLRNLRGIQKLFQVELNDALKESKQTYQEFNKNVSREIQKFL
ncbi:unnamed protein product [Diabrotica balteata]|uniref:Uncharacterized protein n=1 Tax=Diabrotica balteata TaxID=107213 RepID=A0A9N9XEG1_DIABA|nr:unnamed protein product [Diabrotica balteata]